MPNDKPETLQDAQDQADEYGGFARSGQVVARDTGEVFTFRNPACFTDKQLTAYQKLHHRMNKCDRWPDTEVPEQSMKSLDPDGAQVETFTGSHTRRGDYIEPYQEDGVLIDPPYEVQVAQIIFGEETYERFASAGGSSRELVYELSRLRQETEKRLSDDSKSAGTD